MNYPGVQFIAQRFSVLIFALCSTVAHADSKQTTTLESDLVQLMEWFPGNYDNHQQVYREAQQKLAEPLRHRHTNHTFQPVSIDGIPGKTLYAQQYQHYDPKDIYRQRIYSFEVDQMEQAIRLTIYTPKDPSVLLDAHIETEKLRVLSNEDFILKPGCEVFWKFDGEQFNGYLKENACNYFSTRFDTQVYLNETLILKRDALVLHDTAVDIDGNPVFGAADKGPSINLKQ